jgi:hydrogenase-4 component E
MVAADQVVALIGVGTLLTALYLQAESFIRPLISGIALQSLLLAGLLGVLAWEQRSLDLAVLAGLAVAIRAFLIPYLLRRQIVAYRWRAREVRAAQLTTGYALGAVAIALIGWEIYSIALQSTFQVAGGALPFILLLEGFLLLATRTNTLVQVVGYLEEENALVYMGALFARGFPLFVEAVVFLDVLGVVLVGIVLSIQRDVVGAVEHPVVEELTG